MNSKEWSTNVKGQNQRFEGKKRTHREVNHHTHYTHSHLQTNKHGHKPRRIAIAKPMAKQATNKIQNTTTNTTNIIVYHSITNSINNKYINYITLQQYTSDPISQPKKGSHRPIPSNISHSSTIYHFLMFLLSNVISNVCF